jgi:predicted site-specific integrase-resolvase
VGYTLAEAADILDADQKTLRKWMKAVDIEPEVDALDARRRLLSDEQLAILARAFKRNVLLLQSGPSLEAKFKSMARQLQDLSAEVSSLRLQVQENKRTTHSMILVRTRRHAPLGPNTKRGRSFKQSLPFEYK